jgi:putative ABC transport system permease protein
VNARAAVAGPIFLARTGLRSAGRDALLAGAMVAVTAFLLTAAPLWFGRTAEEVLRSRLTAATEAQRGLEYELRGRLDPAAVDPLGAVEGQAAELTSELPATIRGSLTGPQTLVDSAELLAVEAPRPLLRVGLRIHDVGDGIRYVAGRAPTSRTTTIELPDRPSREGLSSWANVYEVAISTGTAAETELGTGDRILMVPGANTAGFIAIDVVGIFDVIDPADERWFADPTLATAIAERISPEVTIYHAIALVDPGAYPVLHGADPTAGSLQLQFRYRWRYSLDPALVATDQADPLAADLARLRAAHPFGGGQGEPSLSTGLADLVAQYRGDRSGAATAVALAMVGPLAAMLGALALVSVAATTRRRMTVRVVRTRGGGIAQVVAGRAAEALLVAIPAALMGAALAALVVEGRWVADALVPALAVGVAAGALAAVPALVGARSPAVGREAGPGGRAGQRRLVLDLLVVAIALAGAASLGRRDVGAAGELNLLLASVPVLVALAGSVVVLRLYPAAVRIAARAAAARTDLVIVHGLRGVSRGAAGQQIPLVALALAVAVGVFSAFVVGTLDRGEARAASEVVGADARVEGRGGAQLPEALHLGEIVGVERTAVAARTEGSLIGAGKISASVDLVALEVPAWLDVVEGRALDVTVPAGLAAPPLLDAGNATSPVAAIVGTETAGRLGLAPGDVALLTVGGRSVTVRALEMRAQFPGLGPVGEAVIVDLAAARVALPDNPLPARLVFVRAPAVAKPAVEAEVARYGAVVALELRDDVLDELRASPLVGAIRIGFGVAVLISLLYALAVVAVATRQAVLARRRELAVLHALGLAPRSVVRLLAVEVGPLVVAALATGIGMGLVIAWLVVPNLALGQLVHLASPAVLAGEPLVLLALGIAPAAGAAVAVAIGAYGIEHTDLADATRAVDP